jgi:probable phosphoglycerate mutase
MRIIALRHGQSEYNLLGLCNDDPTRAIDLTELGIQQARVAAEQLSIEPIEQVFCSPLLRARRTAEIVADPHGMTPQGMTPQVEGRLADIRSGCEGKPVTEFLRAIAHDPVEARVNGGQSLRDYQAQVDGFLRWLDVQPWECILLVAHEETLRIIEAFYGQLPLHRVVGRPFENCVPYAFHSPQFSNGPK